MSQLLSSLKKFRSEAIILFICMAILSLHFSTQLSANDLYFMNKLEQKVEEINGKNSTDDNEKYLTANFHGLQHGGWGNKLFEVIALYGIAKAVKRTPFVTYKLPESRTIGFYQLSQIFNELSTAYRILIVNESEIKFIDFGSGRCCYYDNLTKFNQYSQHKYLAVTGVYLQSYKYFDAYRQELLNKILKFDITNITNSDKQVKLYNENNLTNRHLLCVHIRRGDFVDSKFVVESNENFTRHSILFVRNLILKHSANLTISTILIGNDQKFATQLFANYSDKITTIIFNSSKENVTYDLAFASRHCNSIILTAAASTFGFWMAYLSTNATIYYNYDFSKIGGIEKEFVRDDFFPPNWTPLLFDVDNGNVTIADEIAIRKWTKLRNNRSLSQIK